MKHSEIKIPTPSGFPYNLPDGNWIQQVVNATLVDKGPYFLHPEGSVYLGLSVNEQCELAKMRRPVGKMPKWKTSQMRVATKNDYEKLVLACTEALVHAWYDTSQRLDYVNVYVKVPFNWRAKFSKDLPRAFVLAYDDWTVTISWRVNRILDWLHSKGYSQYSSSELRKSIWGILSEQDKLELYYDVASSQSILELYSEIIDDVKEGKAKGSKSRPVTMAKEVLDKSVKV